MRKRKNSEIPLYGNPLHTKVHKFKKINIAGIECGAGVAMPTTVNRELSTLEYYLKKFDKTSEAVVCNFLLTLRNVIADERVLNIIHKDGLEITVNGLKQSSKLFNDLPKEKLKKVEIEAKTIGETERSFTIFDRSKVIGDKPDFITCSFLEWLELMACIVDFGWQQGYSESKLDEWQSLELVREWWGKKVIKKASYIEYIEKTWKVSHEEAIEMVRCNLGLNRNTEKVYMGEEWVKRQQEKQQTGAKTQQKKMRKK